MENTTTDIVLYETGSGGDFALLADDLLMGESLYQNIYLALFGGNIEASTKSGYLTTEQRFDYWGNDLIWKDQKSKQFNSETERVLKNTTLNSQGRIAILTSANNDLAYLKGVVDLSIDVNIKSISRVAIIVTFKEKTNQQDKVLQLIFDNIKNEVIIEKLI
jgi:phage gp46-like protein